MFIKFLFKFIKCGVLVCCFAATAAHGFPPANSRAESFSRLIEADLDFDGKTERIDLNSEREQTLQIWRGKRLLWQGVPSRWKPWKLEIADVDGDGQREIIVGIFKATKFFPKAHNCLFVYGWAGGRAHPKWLGSSLARPFTDFLFANLDNETGDELVALETTLDEKKSLAVYRWNSFGFTLDRRRGEWGSARILGAKKGEVSVEADGKQIFFRER